MTKVLEHIRIKAKLLYPIFLGMIIAIAAISFISINKVKNNIRQRVVTDLHLQVRTVKSMFEREKALKLKKVKYDLRVAHDIFYQQKLELSDDSIVISAINQLNLASHDVKIPLMKINRKAVHKNHQLIDRISYLSGGTATLFQKIDSGYVRLSTNVLKLDNSRAVNTFIPNNSPVIKTIEKGETYIGRAYVVNDWYITAYEPIVIDGKIQGILYVGDKEKDICDLRAILQKLRIGKSGYVFVFDKNKKMIIEPPENLQLHENEAILNSIIQKNFGNLVHDNKSSNDQRIVAYNYYPDFELYLAASISSKEFESIQIKYIINNVLYSTLIILIFFSLYVIFITTNRVQKFLDTIQESGRELKSAKMALKKSEENFKTLFNSTSDEIFVTGENGKFIFVNQQAINTLGYNLEEFESMEMQDIKSEHYSESVKQNREKVFKKGEIIFESEHKTSEGKILPVEIKSRVIEINNQKAILSISRNMTQRKEMERKLLSVVIQTEERERERFSKDMHDGLGPLLSTIKLYVNELEDDNLKKAEKQEYIKYVNQLLDDAVSSTRTISNNLMPRVIHEYGLVKAVESFCRKVNKTNQIIIYFNAEGISENLDQNIQLIIFRVINELINNTLKHANAENINIKLVEHGKNIKLDFSDNGIGFDVEKVLENKETGIGLKSILSRISSIKGRSNINSKPNEGVKINIEIEL